MVLKSLVLVICTCSLTVYARPEPPYHYPNPSLRATPTANSHTLGVSTNQNFGQIASSGQTFNSIPTNFKTAQQNFNNIPSTSYGTPVLRNTNPGLSVTSSSSSSGIQQGYTGAALPSRSYGIPDLRVSQPPSNRYIPQQEAISIQKHIYVHVAPPEEETPQQRIQQQQVSRQKHYKIIFIKAPSYNPPAPYIAQQQALQEEKTLVYVLVKKPEEAPEVPAQQVAAAKLNKPEVYFIKYKAKSEESSQGGQNVQQQVENVHQEDNESVVIESAAGRGTSTYNQGYNYDRPTDSVITDSAASREASSSASGYNQGYNYDRPAGTLN